MGEKQISVRIKDTDPLYPWVEAQSQPSSSIRAAIMFMQERYGDEDALRATMREISNAGMGQPRDSQEVITQVSDPEPKRVEPETAETETPEPVSEPVIDPELAGDDNVLDRMFQNR